MTFTCLTPLPPLWFPPCAFLSGVLQIMRPRAEPAVFADEPKKKLTLRGATKAVAAVFIDDGRS